jgi:hypothetical protein
VASETRVKKNRPRFGVGVVVGGVVLFAIVLALVGRSETSPVEAEEASGTPRVEGSASEADGVLEVRVLAGGQPVPRARVRLYWRGPGESPSDEVDWRLAGVGATGDDGQLRMLARPGAYLLAVRAEGFAPLLRDVVRPEGEASTRTELRLKAGVPLSGRTVAWTETALPHAELELTPYSDAQGPWPHLAAPVEERVYGQSDAAGRFHFEGLAPGLYRVEVREPGDVRGVERLVRVPLEEEVELVLTPPCPDEGRMAAL